jgi:membrane fusion protein (multidrug efflux system)
MEERMKRIQRLFSIAFIVSVLVLACFAAVIFFGKMDRTIDGPGMVSPGRRISVAPQIDGIVEQVLVAEGDAVSRDDILLTLQSDAMEMEVKRARNRLANARSNLRIAEDEFMNLNTSRSYELGVILADLNEAEQRMEFNRENLERTRKLYEKELVNVEEFERQRLSYESSKSYYEVLKARSEIVRKQLERRIEERRRDLELAKGAFDLAQNRMDKTVVYAPLDGIILTADPDRLIGTMVQSGQPALQIGCFDECIFVTRIDEAFIPDVRPGQEVKIYLNGYPHREYRVFRGVVERVAASPTLSQGRSFFEVKIPIDDPWVKDETGEDIQIKYGLMGKAEIITEPSVRLYKILIDSFSR